MKAERFLKTPHGVSAGALKRESIKMSTKWHVTTMNSMLQNEKYKGDALPQKSYTMDFLTKKREKNAGEVQMYCVEDDHEAIIDPCIWGCVQLGFKRRKKCLQKHRMRSYSRNSETNPFASKIVCGTCNKVFSRKGCAAVSDMIEKCGNTAKGTG